MPLPSPCHTGVLTLRSGGYLCYTVLIHGHVSYRESSAGLWNSVVLMLMPDFREIGGYTSIRMRLLNMALKGPAQFPVVKDGHAMETDQIVSISLYTEYIQFCQQVDHKIAANLWRIQIMHNDMPEWSLLQNFVKSRSKKNLIVSWPKCTNCSFIALGVCCH